MPTHDLVCCSEHYSVLRQCRCPGPKTPTYKDCPYPSDPDKCKNLPLYWNGITEHIVRRNEQPFVDVVGTLKEPPREQGVVVVATYVVGTLGLPLEHPHTIEYRWNGEHWQAQNAWDSGAAVEWQSIIDRAEKVTAYQVITTRVELPL